MRLAGRFWDRSRVCGAKGARTVASWLGCFVAVTGCWRAVGAAAAGCAGRAWGAVALFATVTPFADVNRVETGEVTAGVATGLGAGFGACAGITLTGVAIGARGGTGDASTGTGAGAGDATTTGAGSAGAGAGGSGGRVLL